MKTLFLKILLLAQIFTVPLIADTLPDTSYYHILNYLNTFSSFFPRIENSKGERETVNFITDKLEASNIEYTKYNLSESESVNSWSTTIDARFQGKSGNEIFLIFPVNHPDNSVPGRDGSANLASALFFAEQLKIKEPPQTVHIIFMGAEYGDGDDYPKGTIDYLSNYFPEMNSAFFYFGFEDFPETIRINYSGTGVITPLWLLKKSISAINEAGINYKIDWGINLINRLKLNNAPYKIDQYLNNNYPAILFEGIYSGYFNPDKDKITALQTLFSSLVYHGGGLIPSDLNWDSHYLFLKFFKTEIFINETKYVMFLIILISLIIVYPFVARTRFKKYRKTINRHFWNIPVIFGIMFFLLYISTLIINVILKFQSFPLLWQLAPIRFISLKLSIAMLIFLLTLRLLKGIHFSTRGTFYSAAAMLFIIADLFILISIDIAFSYYILPVFIFVFGFTIFRNRWIKLLFFLLSAIVLLGGTINISMLNTDRVINLIILSPVKGNLLITANLIPLALMIFRLQFLFHHTDKKRAKIILIGSDIILALTTIILFIDLSTFSPYGDTRLQPLTVIENIDIDSKKRDVTFISNSPVQKLQYEMEATEFSIDSPESEIHTEGNFNQPVPEISIQKSIFLNRAKYDITIDSRKDVKHVRVKLSGSKDFLLFDSNFQTKSLDGNNIEFLIGTNPVLPMIVSFTISREYQGEILIELEYDKYPSMIGIGSKRFKTDHLIIFEKKISITNSD